MSRCHDDLMILRVRPDVPLPRFSAGQYTVLGLGNWEPRAEGCQPEVLTNRQPNKLIKRAYSVACAMLDGEGNLLEVNDSPFLEFYIALVGQTASHPPALTPRLFAMDSSSRIYCGPRFHGHYTLDGIARDADIVFAATGTGEAPHNAMATQLLKTGHRGRIVNVTCVRWKKDLGYLATHRRLETMFANYRYVALTTREPENLDPSRPDFVGKRYLQDYFASGAFAIETGISLDPGNTHVFLCGNSDMIGVPVHSQESGRRYPRPQGMVEILESRGFQVDRPHDRGNIHFEKYW